MRTKPSVGGKRRQIITFKADEETLEALRDLEYALPPEATARRSNAIRNAIHEARRLLADKDKEKTT